MNQRDTYRTMIGAYYGVLEMDEYSVKEYVLQDLNRYIIEFVSIHSNSKIDFENEARDVEKNVSIKTKLQDCLIILPKFDTSMEFLFLIKERLRSMDK